MHGFKHSLRGNNKICSYAKNMSNKQINFHNFKQKLFFEFDTITTNRLTNKSICFTQLSILLNNQAEINLENFIKHRLNPIF